MGLVFIGPILASSVLPLLARPTFVFQEVAGKSLLASLKSITINRQQMSSQSPSPILRDPSQRHPPWCLSPLHPLLYCPWKLSPTVLVLLWPHLPSSAGWQIDTMIWFFSQNDCYHSYVTLFILFMTIVTTQMIILLTHLIFLCTNSSCSSTSCCSMFQVDVDVIKLKTYKTIDHTDNFWCGWLLSNYRVWLSSASTSSFSCQWCWQTSTAMLASAQTVLAWIDLF